MRIPLPRQHRRFSSKSIDGWAKSVQKSMKEIYVKVDDGRAGKPIQLVVDKNIALKDPSVSNAGMKSVQPHAGCALRATGSFRPSRGPQQETEFYAETLEIVGEESNPRYDDLSADKLRENIHLRARNAQFAAMLRARSQIFRETHEFFMNRDFIHIDTPKLTRNDCEGGGEVFDVSTSAEDQSSPEEPMYLTVSSQIHLEAMVSRLKRVYTLGPAFRAEKQQSHAHLSEFHMLEAEVAFVDNIEEMCTLVESYVKHMISFLNTDKLQAELEIINSRNHTIEQSDHPFPRITYDEAVKILTSKGSKVTAKSGLSKKNELDLVKHHDYLPVFVTHYPTNQKPFYMARTADEAHTLSFDLLVPRVGELAGGSVRETSHQELSRRGSSIRWYEEIRRRGHPPTAGFGIGFERMLQYLLGIQNIKDTIAFPRWHRHCQC